MSHLISISGLSKTYGAGLQALKNINLDISDGEILALLGPNGAGKTSTLRMLSCVSPVTAGRLTVHGLDVMKEPRQIKSFLGVVTQGDTLDTDLSVLDNLLVYARYFGISRDLAMQRAWDALDLFQLAERTRSKVDELSGGMKRRLLIARALINAPRVLVLDEPTTGLDPQARHLVWQKLQYLAGQGATLLLSTHSMQEAAFLCDRLVILNQGAIIAEGRPDELVARYTGREVVEYRPAAGEREELAHRVRALGADVEQAGDILYAFRLDGGRMEELGSLGAPAVVRPANLEDVFFRLTGRALQE